MFGILVWHYFTPYKRTTNKWNVGLIQVLNDEGTTNEMQILFKFQLVRLQGLESKSSKKLLMDWFKTFGLRWIRGGARKMLYIFHKVGFPLFKLWNNLEESLEENNSQITWIKWSFLNWWLPNFDSSRRLVGTI